LVGLGQRIEEELTGVEKAERQRRVQQPPSLFPIGNWERTPALSDNREEEAAWLLSVAVWGRGGEWFGVSGRLGVSFYSCGALWWVLGGGGSSQPASEA
jgi:hypothetical protein